MGGAGSTDARAEIWDFDGIYRAHAPYIATIALRILGNADDADDIVQEVFLVAHRSFRSVERPERIRAWLATIAVRKSMWRLRRVRLRRWFVSEDADYEGLADGRASPERSAEVARLYKALERIASKDRVIWTLKHVEGNTLDEVASLTGLSKSTVQRGLRRAEGQLSLWRARD